MNGKISLDQTGLFEEIKKNQHDIASVSQTFQDILKVPLLLKPPASFHMNYLFEEHNRRKRSSKTR